jgi:hypothetical protein
MVKHVFICNLCGRFYCQEKEPEQCACGGDDFRMRV